MSYDDFFAMFPGEKSGETIPQPPMQPEQSVQTAPLPKSQPSETSPYDDLDSIAPASTEASPYNPENPANGALPESAIPESPLSVMERAMLGWVRKPAEQEKFLKGNFEDVKLIKTGDESAGFAVKHEGKWFQADPHFEWSMKGVLGAQGGEVARDVAQAVGEYGLRSAGVALGAGLMGAAAVAAAPVAAVGVPLALLATGSAVGLGAMAGSAGAEALDMGTRLETLAPGTAGREPAEGDIKDQMAAAMLFGVEDVTAGGAIQIGAKYTAKAAGAIVKRLGDTPQGKQVVKKIFGMLGADERLVDARLRDPARNATYDALAVKEMEAGNLSKGPLTRIEDKVFGNIEEEVAGITARESAEFAKLGADKGVRAASIDATPSFVTAVDELKAANIINDAGAINPNIVLAPGDKAALTYVLRMAKQGKALSYKDARSLAISISNLIDGETSRTAKGVLVRLKNNIHGDIATSLSGDLGTRYTGTVNKYAKARALWEEMDTVTGESKKFTFLNRLLAQNRNSTTELIGNLMDAGISEQHFVDLLQIQGARQATKLFGKGRVLKYIPAPGPKLAAATISKFSGAKQGLKEIPENLARIYDAGASDAEREAIRKSLPYMNKASQMLRSMEPATRRAMLASPAGVDFLTNTIGGAVMGEEQYMEQLLQQAGLPPKGQE